MHKDGRLQVLCRTRNARIATAWSNDNGDTWSKVTLLDVPNNNSGTDAVTLQDGRHVLIYNNFSTLPGTPKGPRTPLCVAISEDGINWQPVLTLEDSPISQYSYPSIIQGKDGSRLNTSNKTGPAVRAPTRPGLPSPVAFPPPPPPA